MLHRAVACICPRHACCLSYMPQARVLPLLQHHLRLRCPSTCADATPLRFPPPQPKPRTQTPNSAPPCVRPPPAGATANPAVAIPMEDEQLLDGTPTSSLAAAKSSGGTPPLPVSTPAAANGIKANGLPSAGALALNGEAESADAGAVVVMRRGTFAWDRDKVGIRLGAGGKPLEGVCVGCLLQMSVRDCCEPHLFHGRQWRLALREHA